MTGRVCQGVGEFSEVGVVRRGGKRERVEGKERRGREGGRERGNREARGRQASGGGSMSALTSLIRRLLWRHSKEPWFFAKDSTLFRATRRFSEIRDDRSNSSNEMDRMMKTRSGEIIVSPTTLSTTKSI